MAPRASYSKKLVDTFKVIARHIVLYAIYQPPTWPYSIIETNWYHSKFLPKLVYPIMLKSEKKGFSKKKLARLLWGPSAITHWYYLPEATLADPSANPFEGLSTKEGIDFLERTFDIISAQRKGDALCRDWRNVLLPYDDIEQLVTSEKFLDAKNPETARTILQIDSMLWHYCIKIQVGHRAYSQEFHGPYSLGRGNSLLVREYFNLRPTSVWNFSSELPYNKITIYEVYKDVTIEVDMFNHLYLPRAPQNLAKFSLLTEPGGFLTPEGVQNLFENCVNVTRKAYEVTKDFQDEDFVRKTVQMRHLWLEPSMDILNMKPDPPKDFYSLPDKVNEAKKAHEQFIAKMRVEMPGLSTDQAVDKITKMFLSSVYHR